MNKDLVYGILVSLLFIGCSSNSVPSNTKAINVSYSWVGTRACGYTSPVIHLSHVPKGTVSLNIQMDDLDRSGNNHGGGKITYTGNNTIPRGALNNFKGPCPPSGEHHEYKITVKAQNASGQTIGYGKATRKF